jgi:DNA-binding transcriptional MerR regulator
MLSPLHMTSRQVVRSDLVDEPARQPLQWTIGELARSCGVTVRTLHYYDHLGLVVPSTRTVSGHRRYSEDDVHRLYQVLALRRLGLRLETIAEWLKTDTDVLELVRQHLEAVDRELHRHQDLRDRLVRLLEVAEQRGRSTTETLIGAMELMHMHDDYLTPEQLASLEHDRHELGYVGMDRWRAEAHEVMSALRAAYEAGAEPTDGDVQDVVRRILELRQQFAGRDRAISRALRPMHDESAWDEVRAIVPDDPQLRAFWRRARDAVTR